MRALIVGVLILSAANTGCAEQAVTAAQADEAAILPAEASPKAQYARFWTERVISNVGDLPFSSSHGKALKKPLKVWAGLYIRPGFASYVSGPQLPGLHVVAPGAVMPEIVHGGCLGVNVVVDFRTGETLGSWCNVVDGPPGEDGMPTPIAMYKPAGSPVFD